MLDPKFLSSGCIVIDHYAVPWQVVSIEGTNAILNNNKATFAKHSHPCSDLYGIPLDEYVLAVLGFVDPVQPPDGQWIFILVFGRYTARYDLLSHRLQIVRTHDGSVVFTFTSVLFVHQLQIGINSADETYRWDIVSLAPLLRKTIK